MSDADTQERLTQSNSIVKFEDENGELIEFRAERIKPFGWRDLLCGNKEFRLDIEGFPVNSSEKLKKFNSETECRLSLDQKICFHNQPKIFALVDGGWLPLPFVEPANFLADKNVIINLEEVAKGRTQDDTKWWTDLAKKPIKIDPMLYAFEGENRSHPSFDEFNKIIANLADRFPCNINSVEVYRYDYQQCLVVYEFLKNFIERNSREQKFLVDVCPKIVNRCSAETLTETRDFILKSAEKRKLSLKSFVVLAVFGCLFEPNDGIGLLACRNLIKPKKKYTEEMAYNALADIRAIEVYGALRGIRRESSFFLATCDKALAGFWSLLMPENFRLDGNDVRYEMTAANLFPRLSTTQLDDLVKLIG